VLDVPHAYCETKAIPLGFSRRRPPRANGLLWAVMFFGPLAHLERLASGLTPFVPCAPSVPVADDRSIPDFLKREPTAVSSEGPLVAAE
jgi:hypothetical protein